VVAATSQVVGTETNGDSAFRKPAREALGQLVGPADGQHEFIRVAGEVNHKYGGIG
jgi:hypothetical protein